MSIDALYDPAMRDGANRTLMVMLPSAKAQARDLVQYGFVQATRDRGPHIDAVAVEAHLGYYLARSLSGHLQHDIIAPARARNYRRIWLMGISLGGMGALHYIREHPANIEGVILLAPFLGDRSAIAEVVDAGGLALWNPGAIQPDDDERRLLAWLKAYRPGTAALPSIHLAYGASDRFRAASTMLAECLPAAHVTTLAGGHDWATWIRLWQSLLDHGLFASAENAAIA